LDKYIKEKEAKENSIRTEKIREIEDLRKKMLQDIKTAKMNLLNNSTSDQIGTTKITII